jgi:hypothetical protein
MYGPTASRDTLRRGKSRREKSRFQASQKKSKCMDRPRLRTPLRRGKSRRGKSRFQASKKKVNVWTDRVSRHIETREIETWEIAISGVSKKSKCMDRPRLKWGLETWSVHTFPPKSSKVDEVNADRFRLPLDACSLVRIGFKSILMDRSQVRR